MGSAVLPLQHSWGRYWVGSISAQWRLLLKRKRKIIGIGHWHFTSRRSLFVDQQWNTQQRCNSVTLLLTGSSAGQPRITERVLCRSLNPRVNPSSFRECTITKRVPFEVSQPSFQAEDRSHPHTAFDCLTKYSVYTVCNSLSGSCDCKSVHRGGTSFGGRGGPSLPISKHH